jgi:hypothetical protein
MKYIIFIPLTLIYLAILFIIAGAWCLWAFDFKTINDKVRSINEVLLVGNWLSDILDNNKY